MFKKGDIVLCTGTPSEEFKAKHWHSASYIPRPDEPCEVESICESGNRVRVLVVDLGGYRPGMTGANWPLDLVQPANIVYQHEYRIKTLEMRMYHVEYPSED